MTRQHARFVFKLRRNTVLEGDLALARMELGAFFPSAVRDLPDVGAAVQELPQLGRLRGLAALGSNVRPSGTQAVTTTGSLALLPDLIRCLSFAQRIYCITQDQQATQEWLSGIEGRVGPVIASTAADGALLIQAVPHNALFEFSDVIARQSEGAADTRRNLEAMLDALMGRTEGRRAHRLAHKALSAGPITGHLSHGIHYYKAKFFPRLARSILNYCARQLGEGPHRVVDPFVGSGTTLLEAATLGMPSAGLDIDPLSVLISRVKLGAAQLDVRLLSAQAEGALRVLEAGQKGQLSGLGTDPMPGPKIAFPDWFMKNRKMTPEVAESLNREIAVIQAVIPGCDPQVRPLFRVLMSDAISRRIRMRFLGTGVGRFSLTFAKTSAPRFFARSVKRYVKVAATYEWLRETVHLRLAEARAMEADARRLPPNLGTFDILVTSPPYLPASSGRESYARARAPSFLALGLGGRKDTDRLAEKAIGSMGGDWVHLEELTRDERSLVEWLRRDPLRSIKAGPTARYFLDMRSAFAEMFRVLRPGALAAVVSGKQSTFYRFATRKPLYVAPSAALLAEEAESAGFLLEALHDVQVRKVNMNARPRSLDDYYETLIMLRKPS